MSPPLRISPELRNIIYDLAVVEDQPIDISTETQPGLLRTCRQLRSEAIKMYYHSNTFQFTTTSGDEADGFDGLTRWLTRITPHHCSELRTIKIQIGVANGLMLRDTTNSDNAWARLIKDMKNLGCAPELKIHVHAFREEPLSKLMQEMMSEVSYPPVEKRSVEGRYNSLDRHLTIHVDLLRMDILGTPKSAALMWAQAHEHDAIGLFRMAAVYCHRIMHFDFNPGDRTLREWTRLLKNELGWVKQQEVDAENERVKNASEGSQGTTAR